MRPNVLIPVVVLALLLLLGLGAFFYLRDRNKQGGEGQPAPTVAVKPAIGGKSGPKPSATPVDEARNLLRGGATEADLAAAVDRLDGQPGAEDAVFLLLRKLAPTSPRHRLRFAAFYDPLDGRPSGSVAKNAKYAFDEYEAARKAGERGAVAKQEALLDWAEAHEDSGDEGALALIEMLEKGE
jgi:hypothetical protein